MESGQELHEPSPNPFRYIGPLADVGRAMPRRREIQEAITHIQRNEVVSVLASPQTGKTTFLYELRDQLRKYTREVVYLNFEERGYRNLSEVEKDFAFLVQEQCSSSQPETQQMPGPLLGGFLQKLARPKGLVWLIDELPSSGLAADFLRSIRSYYSETIGMESIGSFHDFVFAGSTDLADLTLSHDPVISPFNIAHEVRLTDFEDEQVQEFIRRNAGHVFSDQAAKRVSAYTGGHPFLVQYLCYHLYESDPAVVEGKLENLTILLNELAVEDATIIQTMVRRVWEDPKRPTGSSSVVAEILRGERYPFALSNSVIRYLYLQGCIVNRHGYCGIRNPIFEAILWKNLEIRRKVEGSRALTESVARQRSFEDHFRKLTNFDGFIRLSVNEADGLEPCGLQSGVCILRTGGRYVLEVEVGQGPEPPGDGRISEPLRVENGDKPNCDVEVRVQVESFYELGSGPDQSRFFSPSLMKASQFYRFPITPHDPTPGPIQVFINVYQDVSLIHVIRLQLRIEE